MADTLREYLIKLGFYIDKGKLDAFSKTVSQAAEDVTGLGSAAFASASAIVWMVDAAARQYERLAYVSQRTNVPVANLKAIEFASRQVGVSAEEAEAATESFYQTLRTSPGARGLLGALGSTPEKGIVGLVQNLKKRFGEGGYFIAQNFAQSFGLDEKTFRQYWSNLDRLNAAQEDSKRRQHEAGLDTDDVTQKFLDFSRAMNKVDDNFTNFKTRVAADFIPAADWIVDHVSQILEAFNKLDNDTGGKAGLAAGAVAEGGVSALAIWLAKRLLTRGGRVAGAAAETIFGVGGITIAGMAGSAAIGLSIIQRNEKILARAKELTDQGMSPDAAKKQAMEELRFKSLSEIFTGGASSSPSIVPGKGGPTRGDRNNNPGNIEYGAFALKHGAVGTDGRFAIFPDKASGQAAMDALLQSNYQGMNLAQIQRTWVGNSDPAYLKSMMNSTGLGAGDIPNMNDPEMRKKLAAGMSLGEGTHLTPPGGGGVWNDVDHNVNTHITVLGNLDRQAGKDVLDSQYDAFAKAYSNFQPQVR